MIIVRKQKVSEEEIQLALSFASDKTKEIKTQLESFDPEEDRQIIKKMQMNMC